MNDIYFDLEGLEPTQVAATLTKIQDWFNPERMHMYSCTIDFRTTDEDKDRIMVEYYTMSDEDNTDTDERVQWAKENYISPKIKTEVIEDSNLIFATIFNDDSNVESIGNINKLIGRFKDFLGGLPKGSKILDFKYVNIINQDSLNQPKFMAYIKK